MSGAHRAARALPAALVAIALTATVAGAQDVREFDTIWLKAVETPLVGLITSQEGAELVTIKLKNGVEMEVKRDEIDRVLPRQTPLQAYKEVASGLKAGDAAAHLQLAEWCLGRRLLSEAETELDLTMKADPALAKAYLLAVQLDLERLADASDDAARDRLRDRILRHVRRADANRCWQPRIGLARGRMLLAIGLPEAARTELEKVTGAIKDEAELKPAELWIRKEGLLLLGTALEQLDKLAEAQTVLDRLVTVEPEFFGAYDRRGRILYDLGRLDEARVDFNKALELEPTVVETLVARASVLADQGRLDDAIADLRKALGLGVPELEPVRTRLGLCYLRLGKLKSAAIEFLATRLVTPKADETGEGDGAADGGATKPADGAAPVAGEKPKDQRYGPAEAGLGLVALRRGEAETALEYFRAAQRLMPEDGTTAALRGRALLELNKLDEARAAFRDAIRLGFHAGVGLRRLAGLATLGKQPDRAVELLKYLANSERYRTADDLYRLARLQLRAKQLDEARRNLEAALRLDQNHIPALNGLGYIAYTRNNYEDASRLFTRVLALDAENGFAKRALKNIEESRTRRVWTDEFDRDGPGVANRWDSVTSFGVRVELVKGSVVFRGKQRNKALGKTELNRRIDDGDFVRMEATLDTAKVGAARVGLRLRSGTLEILLWRGIDGKKLFAAYKLGRNGKVKPVELAPWPGDLSPHVLALEVEDLKKGLVGFSLDGERVGGLEVRQLRRVKPVDLVIYGQSELDEEWELKVEKVRVFVSRESRKTSKGGF